MISLGCSPIVPLVRSTASHGISLSHECQHSDLPFNPALSEMSTAVAITPVSQRGMPNSASVGKFLPGIEHRVVAADGKLVKPGEAGGLWVSRAGRAIGYLDNKQA